MHAWKHHESPGAVRPWPLPRRPHTTDRIHARLERSDQTARLFFYRVRSVWCVSCSTICRDMFGTALRAPILASSLAAVLSSRSARSRTTYCVLVPIFFGCAGTYATVYVRKQLTTMHASNCGASIRRACPSLHSCSSSSPRLFLPRDVVVSQDR